MDKKNIITHFITRQKTVADYLLLCILVALAIFMLFYYDNINAGLYDRKYPQLCNRSFEVIYGNKNTTTDCFSECFKLYGCNSTVGNNGRLYDGTCNCSGILLTHKKRLGTYGANNFYIKENQDDIIKSLALNWS